MKMILIIQCLCLPFFPAKSFCEEVKFSPIEILKKKFPINPTAQKRIQQKRIEIRKNVLKKIIKSNFLEIYSADLMALDEPFTQKEINNLKNIEIEAKQDAKEYLDIATFFYKNHKLKYRKYLNSVTPKTDLEKYLFKIISFYPPQSHGSMSFSTSLYNPLSPKTIMFNYHKNNKNVLFITVTINNIGGATINCGFFNLKTKKYQFVYTWFK